ncbi:MAG: hypothetical protein AB7S83_03430 [Candidatus Methanomethylophilaceae archaeon]
MKSCILRNAYEDALLSLMGSNLDALGRLISYNAANGIRMFCISSDLILFGSSLAGSRRGKNIIQKSWNPSAWDPQVGDEGVDAPRAVHRAQFD